MKLRPCFRSYLVIIVISDLDIILKNYILKESMTHQLYKNLEKEVLYLDEQGL